MENFYLEEPTIERKKEALEYLNEFVKFGSELYGTGSMDRCLNEWTYEEFLIEKEKRKDKEYAYSINRCPSKTFFLIRQNDNKIIGMINIRYNITEELLENGASHIGYCIRPTERQKGYNKIQLYLGLLEIQKMGEKRILLECTVDNIGSNKSIQSLGGILEKTELDKYDNTMTNYYWINVEKAINENSRIYNKFIAEEQQIKNFIEQVKLESTYKKYLKSDIINQLINIFNGKFEKQDYSNKIDNSLNIALQFYKEYNIEYYNKIIEGLENEKIIISNNNGKSNTDTMDNITKIRLYGNDSDLFNIVHELAHFIDRNSNPPIIPNDYWFLSETFAFYIEKKLENWLEPEKYKDLISIRINNRMYFENKMLYAIENELYYESLYSQKGIIEDSDIDIEKVKSIMQYDVSSNIVNYLLQYPLANILSDYLINNNLIQHDNEIAEKCINIDLYKILEIYSMKKRIL